ncbi:SDR family oxidoreductase [Plantactinospora siamensis]|uniref:SDR family oxidoreductase n=1 Tax=Plantactinospora siamensis TaxID=555372 RepID=A0ABV6NU07_9ACTN
MTEQRIALVTGANKGIGREVARQLAGRGMTVLLAARKPAAGRTAADELRTEGVEVHPIELDVTDPDGIAAAVKGVGDAYGRLDVLVNNAAITGAGSPPAEPDPARRVEPPSAADLDRVREVYETNVFGVIAVTNAFLPLLRRSDAARIVNVSSGVGSLHAMTDPAGPLAGMPPSLAYPTSKAALNAVTAQYAKEFRGSQLLINAADPGWTGTDLNGHAGPRSVAEGAAIIVRLATLPADGPSGGFFNDDGVVPW